MDLTNSASGVSSGKEEAGVQQRGGHRGLDILRGFQGRRTAGRCRKTQQEALLVAAAWEPSCQQSPPVDSKSCSCASCAATHCCSWLCLQLAVLMHVSIAICTVLLAPRGCLWRQSQEGVATPTRTV